MFCFAVGAPWYVALIAGVGIAFAMTAGWGRYVGYMGGMKGDAKINVSVAYPYDVLRTLKSGEADSADVLWNNLPDYVGGKSSILPIVDVSGSMDLS